MNIPTGKERSYAHSLRMGRRLHPQVGERLLLLLRNGHKNCLMPCELHMFGFMMMFISCSIMGKAHKWGMFPPWGFTLHKIS